MFKSQEAIWLVVMISDTKNSAQITLYLRNTQITVKILIPQLYIWYENLTFLYKHILITSAEQFERCNKTKPYSYS